MTLCLENHSLIYKSGLRFKGDSAYHHSTLGHPIGQEHSHNQNESVYKQGKLQDKSVRINLQDQSVNKSINTTAAENCNGRLSFKGAANTQKKIGGKIMQAAAKNKFLQKFISMADKQTLVFEALFALGINCIFRPATIMFAPTDDPKKNSYNAAKSIASGIVGYVAAIGITNVLLKPGFKKLNANPAKYMSKKSLEFFKDKTKGTSEKVFQRIFEIGSSSIRAGMTIAIVPFIEKNIISKMFGKYENEKGYENSALYFRGGEMPTDSFKKFREGKAKIA